LRHTIDDAQSVRRWEAAGRPIPPPHPIKVRTVKAYSARFATPVLVETGTYRGEMVEAVKHVFETIYSIELDDTLYAQAQANLARMSHIHVIHGDSAEVLPALIGKIDQTILFWLDAHYSGGVTARGREDSPIRQELLNILNRSANEPVILIDDARLFTGESGYPTLDELRQFVLEKRPGWVFEVQDDIIRLHGPG
jgi:hypothetical protein